MRWFYVLTLEMPRSDGTVVKNTDYGTVDVNEGTTRYEIYKWARSQAPGHVQGGSTVFYMAEPNEVES